MKNVYASRTRRDFLTTAVGGGALVLGPARLSAVGDAVDTHVSQAMSGTIGIDMHNHVYPAGTEPHPQNGQQQRQEEQQRASDLFIAEELKRSGLTAVCASFVLDFTANSKAGDAREKLLSCFSAIDAQLEKGHIHRALNLKDLQTAHDRGQPTIIQTVEGSQFIEGRLERVEEVYKRGLRDLQLLHEKDDLVSPLGDTNTGPAHLGGLTAFGAEVVKECNRLGILLDLAHASNETVLGVLKVATQPFIVSHTSLDSRPGADPKVAAMMKPRLISKEHAKVVADAGGVVCQGTDKAWPGLTGGFFNAVVGEMLRQGFTASDISKVGGGNFCRVFGKVTAGHA